MYKHYCKQAISAEVTALENERVCVQLPTSADYVALLALAAVLLCAMLLQRLAAATVDLAWLSTDIAWLPGPQQQTINSVVQRSIDETDRQTLYHYTDPAMYHASSVKNMSPSLALQTFLNISELDCEESHLSGLAVDGPLTSERGGDKRRTSDTSCVQWIRWTLLRASWPPRTTALTVAV